MRSGSAATIWHLTSAGQRLVHADDKRRRTCIEAIQDVAVEVEPASWRRYQGPSGEPRWLQPDLYTEIGTSDFIDRFFLEVDLGRESLPTLLGKCEQFEQYRRSGVEQAKHGNFPLVLWLLTSTDRARKLSAAIRRSSKLTEAMYRCATWETLTQVLAGGAP